ncbi:MAG: DEAD/DEAH box helicase [Acidimicrobiaceae bacterium]|nr:DEAD/DEAH box helicase [Acidimicrobiaceae bacterium]
MTISAPPLTSDGFAALGVPPRLSAALADAGITDPFPIQAATLPDCLAGRDVCGKAPTGSGKTLAFGLGVLARLSVTTRSERRGRRRDGGRPQALVLVPTRELATQVEEVLGDLAGTIGVTVTSVFGGVAYGRQLAALRRGVDVLIACPGRLEDLVARGSVDLAFVDTVVIDEADRMADMGFLPAVRRLVNQTSANRQTLLFSATLDGPVDKLVREYQRSPVRHDVTPAETDRGDVHHHFWSVPADDRITVTAEAVAARGPALVFCRTRRGADRLSQRLARYGLEAAAIHGERSQRQRERALAAFRAGRLDVLVATDVAARGIHVDDVPLVVHYDPPADATDYVHRSGRTGRAGADGIVVSLLGESHIAGARRLQRKLGLVSGVSSPDVSGLPTLNGPAPRPRGPKASPSSHQAARTRPGATATRRRPASSRGRHSRRR